MKTLVVDASVVAKWIFDEVYSPQAIQLLSDGCTLLAPDLVWSEMGSVLWKRVRKGDVSAVFAAETARTLRRFPLTIHPAERLLSSALDLAIATGRTVYDCMYLAIAIEADCLLVTGDERFFNSLVGSPFGRFMQHISQAQPA